MKLLITGRCPENINFVAQKMGGSSDGPQKQNGDFLETDIKIFI
jgi:hypothetical protein